jgi:hypothetical protein
MAEPTFEVISLGPSADGWRDFLERWRPRHGAAIGAADIDLANAPKMQPTQQLGG